ncbi:MAG: calcineurin [Clostridium sp.]|nr:calcineurin [Clostridium sp.]
MRFVIWGDSKGKENGINKKILHSIMNQISNLNPKPEFMVLLGDTVAGGINEEILIKQLFELKDIINNYTPNITLLPVVGNHEVNIFPLNDSYEKILHQFYYNVHPNNSLKHYNQTVYYKDFFNTRIIVLNSFHPKEVHKVSTAQLSWLKDITHNCDKYKLVFIHSPAYPTGAHLGHCLDLYPELRNDFWKTLAECNIDIVFSGHEHNYSRRIIDNIPQVITGGAGEKLKNKYKSKEGIVIPPIAIYHYLLVDINHNNFKVKAITNKGKKIDEFMLN